MERINDGRLLLDVTAQCTKKKHTQSVKDTILIRNKNFSLSLNQELL
jgi:hypothetical protein